MEHNCGFIRSKGRATSRDGETSWHIASDRPEPGPREEYRGQERQLLNAPQRPGLVVLEAPALRDAWRVAQVITTVFVVRRAPALLQVAERSRAGHVEQHEPVAARAELETDKFG